ncbi:hypothetical protein [uncultured Enterococcus sp.]|uniref:hypothetical protein n=1 Tax=uncultured Enterococcus sp. TaxID=167972 RepID=UPI002AA96265|nr:hypothetical protein [uncultured Enterococcus sp.]
MEKTVAVFLHTVMLTDPQYESDMVFVGYEEQANAGEQLSIEEKRHVDSWVTTNVSHDKEQLSEIRVAIDATKSAKKVEQNKESELNLSEEELIQTVESAAAEHDFKEEETVMLQEAGQKITALKNLQLYLDGERIPLEKAL